MSQNLESGDVSAGNIESIAAAEMAWTLLLAVAPVNSERLLAVDNVGWQRLELARICPWQDEKQPQAM